MGRKDLQKKSYFHDAGRFADLINGLLCAGEQVVEASDLTELDSQTGQFGMAAYDRAGSGSLKARRRDLVRRAAFGVNFMVVGLENQEETDYLMPLRCMSYDTAEYERQAAQAGKAVRDRKDITKAEFLSGFAKDGRLAPCVTVVLYYGEDWDGPTALHDILDFREIPPALRGRVNDYQIYLCEVRKFGNTEVFKTDVKQVFDCLRYAEEPDKLYELTANDPSYREMEADTYDVIAEYTRTNDLMKVKTYNEKEGKVDMCKAIAELVERGRREGIEQGIEQGIAQGVKQGIAQGIERGIQGMIETVHELGSTKEDAVRRLIDKMQISDDEARRYVGRYWA